MMKTTSTEPVFYNGVSPGVVSRLKEKQANKLVIRVFTFTGCLKMKNNTISGHNYCFLPL